MEDDRIGQLCLVGDGRHVLLWSIADDPVSRLDDVDSSPSVG